MHVLKEPTLGNVNQTEEISNAKTHKLSIYNLSLSLLSPSNNNFPITSSIGLADSISSPPIRRSHARAQNPIGKIKRL